MERGKGKGSRIMAFLKDIIMCTVQGLNIWVSMLIGHLVSKVIRK